MADLIQDWLIDLGMRCAPTKGEEDGTVRVSVYARALSDLEPRAFSPASLEAMARRFELFPAYAALRKALEAWLDANKVVLPLPGRLDEANIGASERANAVAWLNAAAANATTSELATRLDVIRGKLPSAFRWLLDNDHRARFIAEDRGWVEADNSWHLDDPKVVLEKVRSIVRQPHFATPILLRILRAAVERHAPQNAELVPQDASDLYGGEPSHDQRQATPAQAKDQRSDEGVVRVDKPDDTAPVESKPAAQFYAKHGRPAGTLSPDALHATRLANPLLKPAAERIAQQAAEAKLHAALPNAVFDPDDPSREDAAAHDERPFPWNLLRNDEDTGP